ncbi:MAG: cytochrome P450 [Pseudomonadota bacterium]
MIATVDQASAFLDALLARLYSPERGAPVPIALTDDPALIRHILGQPDIFVKNYAFLEALARGRFTSNGADWRQRAALTQAWYRNAPREIGADSARAIYHKHLAPGSRLDGAALFQRFNDAAVEIFSLAVGLPQALAWPAELIDASRAALKISQWIDWNGCTAPELARVRAELAGLRDTLRAIWHGHDATRALLADLSGRAGQGDPIDGFDAAQELFQAVLASSESTSSSLLWAAETLSRQPAVQSRLAADPSGVERFIAEVLRMFPPVPFLTRRCTAAHRFGAHAWDQGAVLSISIVGMHRHPDHWRAPQCFDADRPEYDSGATPPAYLPFSRGERACAGIRLAKLELRAGLEALLALRRCDAGAAPTRFRYGLSSYPDTALEAHSRRAPAMGGAGATIRSGPADTLSWHPLAPPQPGPAAD